MKKNRTSYIVDEHGDVVKDLSNYNYVSKRIYGYLVAANTDNLNCLINYNGDDISNPIDTIIQFCGIKQFDKDCISLVEKHANVTLEKPDGSKGYLNGMGRELE